MAFRELMNRDPSSAVPVRRRGGMGNVMVSLQDEMNRLLQDFFGERYLPFTPEASSFPAVDITENENTVRVRAELPGMDPDKVDVSVTDGFLTIRGEREEETEEKDEDYLRREISYGSFQRTIALPETTDYDKAEASFRNGVLQIEIPKKAEAVQKPRKLQIRKAA